MRRKKVDIYEPIVEAGKQAALIGQTIDACPYKYELFKRSAWLIGWEIEIRKRKKQTALED
jgi:ribosome modulation factor